MCVITCRTQFPVEPIAQKLNFQIDIHKIVNLYMQNSVFSRIDSAGVKFLNRYAQNVSLYIQNSVFSKIDSARFKFQNQYPQNVRLYMQNSVSSRTDSAEVKFPNRYTQNCQSLYAELSFQ